MSLLPKEIKKNESLCFHAGSACARSYAAVVNVEFEASGVDTFIQLAVGGGLYRLNAVDPQLETARIQPLSLPLDPS
jgi:hypothetical protein